LAAGKILAGLGAHIVILDLNPSEPALREIGLARRAANQLVAGYRINVADRKITMGAVALAASECGAPDILINMAGIAIAEEFINMTSETFDRVIQVNVYGTRNIVEAVLPFMISRGSGKLVLAGSMGGILPVFGYTAYGTSEFAVLGLAQCLRCELKPRGIGIACFCPGEMETPELAEEHRTLHPATRALMKIGGTMYPERPIPHHPRLEDESHLVAVPADAGLAVEQHYGLHRGKSPAPEYGGPEQGFCG